MAKFEGTQDIPSGSLDNYRGTLNPHPTGKIVKKRYPFRLPKMQKWGRGVSPAQQTQRSEFLSAIGRFNTLGAVEKSRWYDSMPPWSSLLWYYNWFMLNAIPGLWGVVPGGAAILKNIQHVEQNIATGGEWVTFATAVDPKKCVLMFNGAAYTNTLIESGEPNQVGYAWPIYPVYDSLLSNSVLIGWSLTPAVAANVTITVIEYI